MQGSALVVLGRDAGSLALHGAGGQAGCLSQGGRGEVQQLSYEAVHALGFAGQVAGHLRALGVGSAAVVQ